MAIPKIFDKLSLHLSPRWNKRTGSGSMQTKVKAKNTQASNIAGRDVNNVTNYYAPPSVPKKPPYVHSTTPIGGNGHLMHIGPCQTFNDGDEIIFLERLSILGKSVDLHSDAIIRPGQYIQYSGRDDLSYPTTNEEAFLETFFHTQSGEHYIARQKLHFSSRQDGKFDVNGFDSAVIELIDKPSAEANEQAS